MGDTLIWAAFAFWSGLGLGGLLVNELAWRGQRRDLERMRRDLDAWEAEWRAEFLALRQGAPHAEAG